MERLEFLARQRRRFRNKGRRQVKSEGPTRSEQVDPEDERELPMKLVQEPQER